MSNSTYADRFYGYIVDHSTANNWEAAKTEWEVSGCVHEDEDRTTDCICGHQGIRYIFTIQNTITGETISPIGSECIKKFNNRDMDEYVQVLTDKKTAMKHGVLENPNLLTGRLISHLLDTHVLNRAEWEFLLQIKRKRYLTSKQRAWQSSILSKIDKKLKIEEGNWEILDILRKQGGDSK